MLKSLSFQDVLAEARDRGLMLNNLSQLSDGRFRCNWRMHYGTGATWFGQHADHERPFDAMLNAYVLADMTAPGKTRGVDDAVFKYVDAPPVEEAQPETEDLFG